MSLSFFTFDERPELRDRKGPLLDAWPRFMLEDEVSNRCWDLLYERFGAFQHFLVSEDDELVAEVNSVPVELDPDALPERGWDEALERGTTGDGTPTVVSAIQVLIAAGRQGQGLSTLCLERMRETAVAHGFEHLVAPVRPSWKDRYPLVPIDRYIQLGSAGRPAPRPVAARPRRARRGARRSVPRVDDDHGRRRRLGGSGPVWSFPTAVTMSYQARSSRSASTARPTSGRTSSRTSGCTTGFSRLDGRRVPRPTSTGRSRRRL